MLFKFEYYKADIVRAVLELVKDGFYIFLASFIIFFGLSCNRLLLFLGSIFLFASGAFASYALYFFKARPTEQMLRTMFENDIAESYEMLSIKLIIWILLSIAICLGILLYYTKEKLQPRVLTTLCLMLFVYNIYHPHYKILNAYFPIQYLHNGYLYISSKFHVIHKLDISEKFDFVSKADDDLVGVLVIGESARFDHFSINGYNRETTPTLAQTPNLFSFKAEAAANLTYLSVPYMLTRVTKNHLAEAENETTVLSVLTKLGFNTGLIGTQTILKYLKNHNNHTIYDEVNISIIPGGSALYQMNAYDEVMLPYFNNFLHTGGKEFIVLHTSGSHWNYTARYPSQYAKFKPTCSSHAKIDQRSCTKEELINSYDNSIFYTDHILSQVIDMLKNKNAFLIYVSDHGESLGENGVYAHGSDLTPEQLTIPFIFWASDKFFTDHSGLKQNLARLQKSKKELTHDYVFHSILDCAKIQSSIIDPELSLCNQRKP